jgi:hypothetical protein
LRPDEEKPAGAGLAPVHPAIVVLQVKRHVGARSALQKDARSHPVEEAGMHYDHRSQTTAAAGELL